MRSRSYSFDVPLVARDVKGLSDLVDPGAFAWEILRRRADYGGPTSNRYTSSGIGCKNQVELIDCPDRAGPWGLSFP
jgi:hypothetical protein